MHLITDKKELREIVDLVRKYLSPHQPSDYTLEVMADAVEREDDWYYVVVRPSRADARSYDYNARLVEAELDLQEQEKRNILLVPALPN